ncbi:UPF0739 protein C1orf74 homolog [Centruroides sculpturatus]|uniref:UPF0739 protein C1orf74 homolog n=1 Tax=Centruroides sculpturatus TaxID=218467 RepID=UPI000C6E7F47|nr:UPF0739 protein C1orf74 homolog [Centruroides sculpturatus]
MSPRRNKLYRRRFRSVQNDILAVDEDIKPAYIWDVYNATSQEVKEYLNELHVASIIHNPLQVLRVKDTLMVTWPIRLVNYLQNIIVDDDCAFVDITNNTAPSVLKEYKNLQAIEDMVENVIKQLKEIINLSLDSELEIICDTKWNLTSLFGILSGYPVVYWYDCEMEKSTSISCLFTSTLKIYHVWASISAGKPNHRIYSFSIPESLVTEVRCHVSAWFDKLVSRVRDTNGVFESLQLTRKVTELYSVAL